jgi:hypothetical protein
LDLSCNENHSCCCVLLTTFSKQGLNNKMPSNIVRNS